MKNHFIEYENILLKINEVQAKIIELKESIYSVRGIRYDDIPRSTAGNADLTYYLIEIEELEQELAALNVRKSELIKHHESEIEKVHDNKYKSVLRMHYLKKFDVGRIADTLNVSTSYAWKLKREAINAFKIANDIKG